METTPIFKELKHFQRGGDKQKPLKVLFISWEKGVSVLTKGGYKYGYWEPYWER